MKEGEFWTTDSASRLLWPYQVRGWGDASSRLEMGPPGLGPTAARLETNTKRERLGV